MNLLSDIDQFDKEIAELCFQFHGKFKIFKQFLTLFEFVYNGIPWFAVAALVYLFGDDKYWTNKALTFLFGNQNSLFNSFVQTKEIIHYYFHTKSSCVRRPYNRLHEILFQKKEASKQIGLARSTRRQILISKWSRIPSRSDDSPPVQSLCHRALLVHISTHYHWSTYLCDCISSLHVTLSSRQTLFFRRSSRSTLRSF